ncbi:hypothetical protein SAMN02745194_04515 [Roseomonas rosea]|uniref:Uncharacterized protein n=1 Tax=Muricoccus roseus TaxID=198092 RepID=A0A1M6QUK3_9PROT|nr:hypothetical protein [Roseomonas rosea]SHK23707.1 hypothetical protein SAMN02745194_04515 [Roseomonas rosea]
MSEKMKPTRYVIINDCDAPEPRMVCQWVPGVGYCYLDRRGIKPTYDGMTGTHATPVEAFGFVWTDNPDGTVSFYRSERPVTATYQDGKLRRWQDRADGFEFRRLVAGALKMPENPHA